MVGGAVMGYLGGMHFWWPKISGRMYPEWLGRFAALTVFLGRMVPGFRTLVSFPAGAVKMSLPKFIVYTTGGCLIWNAFLVFAGVYLGTNWPKVASVSRYIIIGVVAAILVALIVFLIRRRKRTSNARSD
jgi:membrane protein DedA with SNARE-associated domain